MIKNIICTALMAGLPLSAYASEPERPIASSELADPTFPQRPKLSFFIAGGGAVEPAYFGSDNYVLRPKFALGFGFLRLSSGQSFGSEDLDDLPTGFAPRGSLRIISKRTAADNPELTGLDDVDLSIELGLGAAYRQRNFRVFADARYGIIGHQSWVGEFGADLIFYPNNRLTMTFGPRLLVGDSDFANTYFGVSAAESAASGLAAFNAKGGVLSAGLELGAAYKINEDWGLTGAVQWNSLTNDAESSPITALGDPNQFTLRIGVVRRFTLNF